MKVIDWLNDIIDKGLLCEKYTKLVNNAHGKKALFDIVCDANGISYLPEMREKGMPLPYDVIEEEFGKYINGKCKNVIKGKHGGYYDSVLYCSYDKDVEIDTTLACFLNCCCDVFIKEHNICNLYADTNCVLNLHVPEECCCEVYCYGNCSLILSGNTKNVKIYK